MQAAQPEIRLRVQNDGRSMPTEHRTINREALATSGRAAAPRTSGRAMTLSRLRQEPRLAQHEEHLGESIRHRQPLASQNISNRGESTEQHINAKAAQEPFFLYVKRCTR